jgi:L-threonylcarbamoyladenylate synthase
MITKIVTIDTEQFNDNELEEAAMILRNDGLVAFPTETVYGLGANGLNPFAAKKIYAAKGRPSDNPLIIHIADMKALEELTTGVNDIGMKLANAFWPGPLTLICNKSDKVPYGTTGGLETVAIRMPSHPIAYELIKRSKVYVAAPSANVSGRPSPTKAEHVIEDLSGIVDMIIDGGKVSIGLESTIVDITGEIPTILRPGFITIDMLKEVVGEVEYDPAVLKRAIQENIVAKAPGMKYKHYAPKGELTIFEGENEKVLDAINKNVAKKIEEGYVVGVIGTDETIDKYPQGIVKTIGTRSDEETIARGLFEILRDFDKDEVQFIYSESFQSSRLGQAIMNRLLKAAGYHIEMV